MTGCHFSTKGQELPSIGFLGDLRCAMAYGMLGFSFGRLCRMRYASAGVARSGLRILAGGLHILFCILRVGHIASRHYHQRCEYEFSGKRLHAISDAETFPMDENSPLPASPYF